MMSQFMLLGLSFLALNKKSTISILFSIELLFFTIILIFALSMDLSAFFLVMCVIVISATFSLAIFVKTLSLFSSESQQMFLDWGFSMLVFTICICKVLLAFTVYGMQPWSGWGFKAMIFLNMLAFLFFLSPTFLNLWIMLLLSTLFITMKLMKECKMSAVKYFIFQELASWAALLSVMLFTSSASVMFLVLKMGLPPFHSWIVSILQKLNLTIKWLLVGSKIVPSFLCLSMQMFWFTPLMIILSSLIFFSASYSMKEIFIMSSGFNISWGLLTQSELWGFSFIFIFSYFWYIQLFIEFSIDNSPMNLMEYLVVLGLPPSGFFFMKLFMISLFSQQMLLLLLLILSMGFLINNYLKLMEKYSLSWSSISSNYLSDKGWWFTIYMLLLMILFSF